MDFGLFLFELHLLRSLFMSQEALVREIAEMRRQIAREKDRPALRSTHGVVDRTSETSDHT
jgi:hypothetical protein